MHTRAEAGRLLGSPAGKRGKGENRKMKRRMACKMRGRDERIGKDHIAGMRRRCPGISGLYHGFAAGAGMVD